MNKLLTLLFAIVVAPSVMAFAPLARQRSMARNTATQRNVAALYPPKESVKRILGDTELPLQPKFNEKNTEAKKTQPATKAVSIESVMMSTTGALLLSILLMAAASPTAELAAPDTYTDAPIATKIAQQQQQREEEVNQMVDQSAGFYFF
jgi:hypothetical protein